MHVSSLFIRGYLLFLYRFCQVDLGAFSPLMDTIWTPNLVKEIKKYLSKKSVIQSVIFPHFSFSILNKGLYIHRVSRSHKQNVLCLISFLSLQSV